VFYEKLFKRLVSLIFACILLSFTSIQVFANADSINRANTNPPIAFKADDQQLEMINKLSYKLVK